MNDEKRAACQAVLAEIDSLAGCKQAKEQMRRLAMQILVFGQFSGHFAFMGDPGTGKSSMARLTGKLLHACGMLPTDRVVECARSNLISGYIGATAGKTRSVCESALGGVLVIDDAGQFLGHEGGFVAPFDREALIELITFAESHRGEFFLIFTGNSQELHKLFETDPWFSAKVSHVIHFEPFTPEDVTEVFLQWAERDGITLAEGVRNALEKAFADMYRTQGNRFGNARAAIRLYEYCRMNLAKRILEEELPKTERYIMTVGDIPNGQEGLL